MITKNWKKKSALFLLSGFQYFFNKIYKNKHLLSLFPV